MAKSTIEAKFTVALHNPRKELDARQRLIESCDRPRFAAAALYAKPVGGSTIEGLSIRFAEAAIQAWRNVDISAVTAWEDNKQRLVRITVTDLESNISYSDEVLLNKTVERKFVRKGQTVLSERQNTNGEKTYLVIATEDEMQNKLNAAKSKSIRNSGLRLIPQDILEECQDKIRATIANGGGESIGDKVKGICDAFAPIGVKPSDLEAFLGHSLDQISPSELVDLRAVYTTISEGEATWAQYMEGKEEDDVPMGDAPASKAKQIAGKVKSAKKTAKPKASKKKAAKQEEKPAEEPPADPDPAGEETEPETEPDGGEGGEPELTESQEVVSEFLGFSGVDFETLISYCQNYGLSVDAESTSVAEIPDETCAALVTNKMAPSLPDLKKKFGSE